MAGKSTGQWLGAIAGGIIGSLVGYTMLGIALGGAIGRLIDPPDGPKGPRLDDLRVQTSAFGLPIPYVRGRMQVSGNVFWVENNELKEDEPAALRSVGVVKRRECLKLKAGFQENTQSARDFQYRAEFWDSIVGKLARMLDE